MIKYLIAAAVLVACATAFPVGAPLQTCSTRTPVHFVENTTESIGYQNSTCPFEVSGLFWTPGQYTPMGIYVRPGYQVSFRGFLISVFDKATNLPVGRMRQTTQFVMASIPSNITTKLVCDNTSLTHWTADDKKIIFFEWEAPWTFTEDNDLEIRLTIVQERETFWKDCNSVWFPMKLQNAPPTTTTFAPPTTTTAFPDITEQLTTLAATTRAPLTRTTSRNLLKLRFGFAGR